MSAAGLVRWIAVLGLVAVRRSEPAARRMLLAEIRRDPGIHKSELRRVTGLAWGQVSHHLSVLHRQRRIQSLAVQGRTAFFPASGHDAHHAVYALLRQPLARDVASELQSRPGQQLTDLSQRLQVSRKRITRVLQHFGEAGAVRAVGNRHKHYSWKGPQVRNDEVPKIRDWDAP